MHFTGGYRPPPTTAESSAASDASPSLSYHLMSTDSAECVYSVDIPGLSISLFTLQKILCEIWGIVI